MNKPPLVGQTMVLTSTEKNLIELQRAMDAEHYEAEIERLKLESESRLELIQRLTKAEQVEIKE